MATIQRQIEIKSGSVTVVYSEIDKEIKVWVPNGLQRFKLDAVDDLASIFTQLKIILDGSIS